MSERVLGVLGGMDMDDGRLSSWAESATVLYAADSGADRLISLGYRPVVVGDFDSFSSQAEASDLRLVRLPGQDTTDCDKLLALARQDGHDEITLTCVEGDLPDHAMATLSSAAACEVRVRIAFRRGIGWVVKKGAAATVATTRGQRVSLMPITDCSDVIFDGVQWPLDGAELAPAGSVSVSNQAVGPTVRAEVGDGAALLFVETSEVAW
ncbi:MAG: thiamine diphosphokinase [Armatimonadetes bacterium]|nr:thiamine diphosphokinase [Armatimonadota bacterium]